MKYIPVQWNANKYAYDAVVLLCIVAYILIFLRLGAGAAEVTRLVDGQILQIRVSQDFDPVGAGVRVWEQDELRHVIRGSQEHLEALLDQRGLVRRAYVVK